MNKNRALIHFPGALGDRLAARLDLPATPPTAFALFAHCFTCSKDSLAASRISAALTENGLGVLRFDFTGLGASEGDFANTNFSSNVADLVAAASWLREHHQAPRILIGHSLGGAAVLTAATKIPESVAVATIGAPHDPVHVRHLLEDAVQDIKAAGEADVTIAGRKFRIKKQFLDDISSQKIDQHLSQLRKALVIFHSPFDNTVNIENAGLIFAAAKHPKSFISLDDADHLLTRKGDALYVASVLASWASRYVKAVPRPAVTGKEGVVTVSETQESKFTQLVNVGSHQLRADEPESFGGTNSGPSPYDLLLASLGACTSMTLRLYAEQKKLPLEHVTVRLKHERSMPKTVPSAKRGRGKSTGLIGRLS